MNFFLQTTLAYLLLYKYVALFFITFFAAIALPLPSSPSLMAASAFAAQHYFNIWLVIVTASLGNILGDVVCYWLARLYGKDILYRIGFRKVLESETFDWIKHEMTTYHGWVIFLSRANVLTTISVNIVAGLSKLTYKTFLFYVIIGEVFQVLLYAGIGYFFGSNWQGIYDIFGQFSIVLILLLLLALTLLSRGIKKHLIKRRDHHIRKSSF